jgi:hypothetical protein
MYLCVTYDVGDNKPVWPNRTVGTLSWGAATTTAFKVTDGRVDALTPRAKMKPIAKRITCYDAISKTWATPPKTLFHRAIMISYSCF